MRKKLESDFGMQPSADGFFRRQIVLRVDGLRYFVRYKIGKEPKWLPSLEGE